MTDPRPRISVIVPVLDGAATLPRCLTGLSASHGVSWECIVVDDGSIDHSCAIARRCGARVISTGRRATGPALARNVGVAAARGDLVCFLDADVVPTPDTLRAFVDLFDTDSEIDAAFGSYDDRPAAPDFFSQYRNLLHHYVHQHSAETAQTFWSGCGAIRRDVFLAAGGFDARRYTRPSIEDIELGARLNARGYRIRLARHIQVTHLKRWTLGSIIRTDIEGRAVPWSRLIVQAQHLPNDLNLTNASRISAAAVASLGVLAMLALFRRWALGGLPLPVAVLVMANRGLYGLFLRHGGLRFAAGGALMHWLYFGYSALAFAWVLLTARPRPRA